MALRNKKNPIPEKEDKSIEISAEMQGTLVFKDPVNLIINGTFKGSLQTAGTLTIGSPGIVEADITGDLIIIGGRVNGMIKASQMITLLSSAILKGDIITPKLNIQEGAIFQGHCQMTETILNIDQVANYLEIDIKEIQNLANSVKIPATRLGDNWEFDKLKIDSWAASGKVS
jgi:cytoskeletal protein CcmA (bactofilin family)